MPTSVGDDAVPASAPRPERVLSAVQAEQHRARGGQAGERLVRRRCRGPGRARRRARAGRAGRSGVDARDLRDRLRSRYASAQRQVRGHVVVERDAERPGVPGGQERHRHEQADRHARQQQLERRPHARGRERPRRAQPSASSASSTATVDRAARHVQGRDRDRASAPTARRAGRASSRPRPAQAQHRLAEQQGDPRRPATALTSVASTAQQDRRPRRCAALDGPLG